MRTGTPANVCATVLRDAVLGVPFRVFGLTGIMMLTLGGCAVTKATGTVVGTGIQATGVVVGGTIRAVTFGEIHPGDPR